MGEVLGLAFTAAVNPTLVTVTTLILLLPAPKRLLAGYLLGALMTSITLGLLVVYTFKDPSAVSTTRNTLSPSADIALGALALVLALMLGTQRDEQLRGRLRRRREGRSPKIPRWQRALDRGSARVTFVVGACLTLPGASYLAGLSLISKLDYSGPATVAVIIGFNLIMMMLIELPLLGYLLAPEATPRTIDRFKAWFARRARHYAVIGFTLVGAALALKGFIGLAL